MKEIKLTKKELERLLRNYLKTSHQEYERLVEVCKDLDHADEKDLYMIYNAFCQYLRVNGLRVYRMSEFDLITFTSNTEQKMFTENVDLDDQYFAMDLYGIVGGYKSFNDLHSYLNFRIPLSLRIINDMLEYTFEDEEEGEEDE